MSVLPPIAGLADRSRNVRFGCEHSLSISPLQNLPDFAGERIAGVGFRQQVYAGIQPSAMDDGILGIAGCEKHGEVG